MTYSYYTIETPKGSNVRFAKDPLTNTFCYRRSHYTTYPAYYGFVQQYDPKGRLITKDGQDLDFFLISQFNFTVGLTIKEKDLTKLAKLVCLDLDTNETDDKLIVVLKEEQDSMSCKSLLFNLDSIISFLICRRSNFVIKEIIFYEETPTVIKQVYGKIDWTTNQLWPKGYQLKNPDEKAF